MHDLTGTRRRRGLVILLLLFLGTRLWLFLGARPWDDEIRYTHFVVDDARFYYWTAINLARGNGFSEKPYAPFVPSVGAAPMFPFVLAAGLKSLGPSVTWVVVGQMLLQLATLLLVYELVRRFFSDLTALIAMLYCVLDPNLLVQSARIHPETLYFFADSLFLFLLLRSLHNGFTRRRITLIAVLLSTLILIGEINVYLLVTLVICLAMKEGAFSAVLRKSALVLACIALLTSPWLVRNHLRYQRLSLSTTPGVMLLKGYAVPFLAEVENLGRNDAKSRLLENVPEFDNPFERSDHLRALAIDVISEHPWRYLLFHLRSVAPLFGGANTSILPHLLGWAEDPHRIPAHSWPALAVQPEAKVDTRRSEGTPAGLASTVERLRARLPASIRHRNVRSIALLAANAVLLTGLYALLVIGVIELKKRHETAVLVLTLFPVISFALLLGPSASSAARLQILPFLLFGACVGLNSLEQRYWGPPDRRPRSRRSSDDGPAVVHTIDIFCRRSRIPTVIVFERHRRLTTDVDDCRRGDPGDDAVPGM